MIITLKRDGSCSECGATLTAGSRAAWYRNGAVYGLDCHARSAVAPRARRGGRLRTAYEMGDESPGAVASHYDRRGVYSVDGRRLGTVGPRCEDAPCCGCCS